MMNKDEIIKKWEASGLLEGLGNTSTYSNELIFNVPEVNLTLTSIEVKAETRKIQTRWTMAMWDEIVNMPSVQKISENYEMSKRVKRQRYKDRKMYVKLIEEWCGEKINKSK